MNIGLAPWLTLLLILGRILSLLVTAPLFSRRDVPALAKLGLGLFLSLLIMAQGVPHFVGDSTMFLQAFLVEILAGLAVGLLASWLVASFSMGGQVIDQQAGFGTASVFDPGSGATVTIFGNLMLFIGLLLFLELNAHHLIIIALMRSFDLVPVGDLILPFTLAEWAARTLMLTTVLFLRLAMPIMAVMIITDLALGMMGRAVPQLNILMLGLPLKAAITFLIFALLSPLFLDVGQTMFTYLEMTLAAVLGGMAP